MFKNRNYFHRTQNFKKKLLFIVIIKKSILNCDFSFYMLFGKYFFPEAFGNFFFQLNKNSSFLIQLTISTFTGLCNCMFSNESENIFKKLTYTVVGILRIREFMVFVDNN